MKEFVINIGKAIMLPIVCLPICALLMGLGYFLCPEAVQGGEVNGFLNLTGLYLVKAGVSIIDRIPLLFAIGIGFGMSEKNDAVGGLAALIAWLIITTLLNADNFPKVLNEIFNTSVSSIAFSKIENPFIGIISGIIGSYCYNHFHQISLPQAFSFFSGKRFVTIASGFFAIVASIVLLFVWPTFFDSVLIIGNKIAKMDVFSVASYSFLNRLLIPVGMHHALNSIFWFDIIGIGDLTHYWAGHTSQDVSWSLGMYMSGFFPCMMFGIPGAALAICHSASPKKRKTIFAVFASSALCSFVCGVTEPFEFSFLFISFKLYVLYAFLYSIVSSVTFLVGFRAGFCFSAGVIDLLFSSSLPAAQNIWMIIPLGIGSFTIFYFSFRIALKTFCSDYKRYLDTEFLCTASSKKAIKEEKKYSNLAFSIIQAIGGEKNIVSIENCITRLRLTVVQTNLINDKELQKMGTSGCIILDDTHVQIVIGLNAQHVADAMKEIVYPTQKI